MEPETASQKRLESTRYGGGLRTFWLSLGKALCERVLSVRFCRGLPMSSMGKPRLMFAAVPSAASPGPKERKSRGAGKSCYFLEHDLLDDRKRLSALRNFALS